MNKYKRYIPVIALVLVALGVNLDKFGIDLEALSQGQSLSESTTATSGGNLTTQSSGKTSHQSTEKWSKTSPEINLWHVFDGEISRRGKPTGYHSRPGGVDAANARVVSIRDKPNRAGVYTATIEVNDDGQWKQKFSSFFPDNLSQQEVIDIILHAYSNSNNKNAQPWSGPSGMGFSVQGYTTSRGGINTAFPVYNANQ